LAIQRGGSSFEVTIVILGIDPGLDGGIAILDGSSIELLETIPTQPKGGFIKRQIDAQKLSNILRVYPDLVCYLEGVASRPGQGVASVFSFGDTYGAIRGVLGALNIPTYTVTPSKWKKELKISSKEDSLKASKELFPSVQFKKKDHNIAEALLIAYYGQKERENVKNDV
jgi:crossover junction endodeoxyribonuclease RuvC